MRTASQGQPLPVVNVFARRKQSSGEPGPVGVGHPCYQPATEPPSTGIATPVTNDASSEQSHSQPPGSYQKS